MNYFVLKFIVVRPPVIQFWKCKFHEWSGLLVKNEKRGTRMCKWTVKYNTWVIGCFFFLQSWVIPETSENIHIITYFTHTHKDEIFPMLQFQIKAVSVKAHFFQFPYMYFWGEKVANFHLSNFKTSCLIHCSSSRSIGVNNFSDTTALKWKNN